MTPLELDYVRTCTKSHCRDLLTAKHLVTCNGGLADMATITELLDKVGRGIDMMYITLEAELPVLHTDTTETTAEVKDNG